MAATMMSLRSISQDWYHDDKDSQFPNGVRTNQFIVLLLVATCGYNEVMAAAGVRELKDNLSRYIRRVEAGERIAVTAHGRVVAELVPPETTRQPRRSRWDELLAAGTLRAPLEAGDP